MATTAVETTSVVTEYPRCLPASDLTYIGQGKHITLEQNDWLGHAVTTQTAALLMREVLGFNVTLLESPMNWGNDDNSMTRLVSGQVDANLEGWAVDWPTDLVKLYQEQTGVIERSVHDYQGRVGAYVPRYVVEDNPGTFPEYWRSYTEPAVLDLFRWNDTAALDIKRTEWAANCDAEAFGCVGGEWSPPRCQESACIPFFHLFPVYASGWIEQLVQNLGLNMSVYYAGMDLYQLIRELGKDRRPIMFFSWRPHELLAEDEYVRVTFPERNQACEAQDTQDRFGGRDCDQEGSPMYKFTARSLASRSSAAHEFLTKRYALTLDDQYELLRDLEYSGHGGNLTTQESACLWAKNNEDRWSQWIQAVATEPPSCNFISFDQIGQFPISQQSQILERCFSTKEQESDNLPTILGAVLAAVAFATAIFAYVYVERRKRNNDSVWVIQPSELTYDDPPVIAGRGTFGLVLIAKYRGTTVAVKRVIPCKEESGNNTSGARKFSASGSLQEKPEESRKKASNHSGDGTRDVESGTSDMYKSSACNGSGQVVLKRSRTSPKVKRDEYARLKADFIVEMRQLSKLRHPAITTVMAAVIAKGEEPLLVMEYMEHGSLYDMLHNETIPLDGDLLLPILLDIACGIRFLHAANPQILHGDLKAANVLVDRNFRAKVADFGLSAKKAIGGSGTPAWMAPELLRRESSNTSASDVYSFGIIIYEIYSRKDPYDGEDMQQVLRDVADLTVNKRPPVPPACPAPLASLMADCLSSAAEARPAFEEIELRMKRLDTENVQPGDVHLTAQARKHLKASRSEDLLFKVFPKHIAEALRDGRKVEPEHHELVSIYFSDIVGFTEIASKITPMKVQDMLDRLYSLFDNLSVKHDVFKIETVGDAYLCVSNLVKDQDEDHAKRIAMFSIDAVKGANETLIDVDDPSLGFVQIRVGFHSGPVISSVVGTRLPKYSMFGDTINTAARMENTSLKGRIQCSERSAKLLIEQCPGVVSVIPRGEIEVKGKGKMQTYWVKENALEAAKRIVTKPVVDELVVDKGTEFGRITI